jgi:hypothetical protein
VRHHPRHQQRYAEGFESFDFAHVVSPWSGKWNYASLARRSSTST